MADAGASWNAALTGLGNDWANAMNQYHKEHQAYDDAASMADALSRVGIDKQGRLTPIMDETGKKRADVTQVIDPKALQLFQANTAQGRAKAQGALEVLTRLGIQQAARVQAGSIGGPKQELLNQRILQTRANTRYRNVATAQLLNLLPPKPAAVPTGNAILANQRALIKSAETGQKRIEDKFAARWYPDPSVFVDPTEWKYGVEKTTHGLFGSGKKTTYEPTDPESATHVQIAPGKWIPKADATELAPQVAKWRELGNQAEALKKQTEDMSQKWMTLPENKRAAAAQFLLQNPTPQMKGFFDQRFGQGAADAVINAAAQAKPQPTPTPTPETETADEQSTAGEEEDTTGGE